MGIYFFKRRHDRQASLGTTTTSPSMRRRSMESTISMIHEALDGKDLATHGQASWKRDTVYP
ncbi:hypothetical protein EV424DRAFT_1404505 [Suillus variegatus]|nr:hypothetical protein EV424DRAFT_1404505 [Suillus variegatus]